MIYLVDSAGRAHHRPGADVPRAPRRGPHLLQRGAPVRAGAAGVRAVRALGRRRRLHPRLLRRRDHARGQRVDVPRLAAHGGDGDRREGDARGDGRREDAHLGLGLRPLPRRLGRGGHRPRARATCPTSRRTGRSSRRPRRPPRRPATRAHRGHRAGRPEQAVRHARADRRARRRGLVARGAAEVGARAGRRVRAARRPRRRHRREPAEGEGRRAVRRLGRQGGALHLDLQRLQRPAAVPRRRARAS